MGGGFSMKTSLPTVLLNNTILFPKNEIILEFDNEFSKNIISEAEFFHDNTLLISYNLNKLELSPIFLNIPSALLYSSSAS